MAGGDSVDDRDAVLVDEVFEIVREPSGNGAFAEVATAEIDGVDGVTIACEGLDQRTARHMPRARVLDEAVAQDHRTGGVAVTVTAQRQERAVGGGDGRCRLSGRVHQPFIHKCCHRESQRSRRIIDVVSTAA